MVGWQSVVLCSWPAPQNACFKLNFTSPIGGAMPSKAWWGYARQQRNIIISMGSRICHAPSVVYLIHLARTESRFYFPSLETRLFKVDFRGNKLCLPILLHPQQHDDEDTID